MTPLKRERPLSGRVRVAHLDAAPQTEGTAVSAVVLVVLVLLLAGLGGLVAELLQAGLVVVLVVAALGAAAGFFAWTKVKHVPRPLTRD